MWDDVLEGLGHFVDMLQVVTSGKWLVAKAKKWSLAWEMKRTHETLWRWKKNKISSMYYVLFDAYLLRPLNDQ